MKKIINGKRYNTMTAKKLGTNSSICSTEDPNWWVETLYQKQTGEYFLYAEGGTMSKYRAYVSGNSWESGKRLIPLEINEARAWAEQNLNEDIYKKVFCESGDSGPGSSKKLVTLSLSQSSINKLARIAIETKKTKSEIIDTLIKES